jgi:hypothetical protein
MGEKFVFSVLKGLSQLLIYKHLSCIGLKWIYSNVEREALLALSVCLGLTLMASQVRLRKEAAMSGGSVLTCL